MKGEKAPEQKVPIKWRQLIILAWMNFNEGFQTSLISPFAPVLVKDYFGQEDPNIGFYVSGLISAFFFGQFVTSGIWGRLSDRYGRRPILLIGLGGSASGVILFGFNLHYYVSLIARFMGGCLNGNLGVTRSYLGEITHKSNQAFCFSIAQMGNTVGLLCGPLIGGFLNNPAENLPNMDTEFWRDYPYLLPCLFSAGVCFIGTLLGMCVLPESEIWLQRKKEKEAEANKLADIDLGEKFFKDKDKEKEKERDKRTTSQARVSHASQIEAETIKLERPKTKSTASFAPVG